MGNVVEKSNLIKIIKIKAIKKIALICCELIFTIICIYAALLCDYKR